jgi:hypothetical protein
MPRPDKTIAKNPERMQAVSQRFSISRIIYWVVMHRSGLLQRLFYRITHVMNYHLTRTEKGANGLSWWSTSETHGHLLMLRSDSCFIPRFADHVFLLVLKNWQEDMPSIVGKGGTQPIAGVDRSPRVVTARRTSYKPMSL